MDQPLLTTLNNLETSLLTLTDSLTTYSPSLSSGQTLLTASHQLQSHLQTLQKHTTNTLLLAHLRSQAAHLSAQYTSQVSALASLRAEILAAGVSGPEERRMRRRSGSGSGSDSDAKNHAAEEETIGSGGGMVGKAVPYKTVLAFARSISQQTAPRGFKPPSVLRKEAEEALRAEMGGREGDQVQALQGMQNTQVNGHTVPGSGSVPVPALPMDTSMDMSGVSPVPGGDNSLPGANNNEEAAAGSDTKTKGLEALAPDIAAWLDPALQVPFLPWPNEEQVARSGLGRMQGWAGAVEIEMEGEGEAQDGMKSEAGPVAGPGVGNMQGGEEGIESAAASEPSAVEEDERRRRAAAGANAAAAPKPKVFMGLDLYDPDEE